MKLSAAKKKKKLSPAKIQQKELRLRKRRVKRVIAIAAFVSVFLIVSALGVSEYKKGWEEVRDLSVIGNGTPTVVQVHDTGCSLCRELRSNTESAYKDFEDKFQYRIADIGISSGRRLQRKYNVPHVTLLFFDRDGRLQRNINGVKSADEIRQEFESFLKRRRR